MASKLVNRLNSVAIDVCTAIIASNNKNCLIGETISEPKVSRLLYIARQVSKIYCVMHFAHIVKQTSLDWILSIEFFLNVFFN